VLLTSQGEVPLQVFGQHNLMNLEGARHVCHQLGIGDAGILRSHPPPSTALRSAWKNWRRCGAKVVFKDFAHSPSKLKATVEAVREQFPDRHHSRAWSCIPTAV
jgi:UDP-N-acetylmuramate: L-alanyl-gamma-D-glutamyl-meso-diaminopimelate ligase